MRILSPDATVEEVAALVAVFAALSAPAAPPPPTPRPTWADPGRATRRALPHGPGAWRASGLPR